MLLQGLFQLYYVLHKLNERIYLFQFDQFQIQNHHPKVQMRLGIFQLHHVEQAAVQKLLQISILQLQLTQTKLNKAPSLVQFWRFAPMYGVLEFDLLLLRQSKLVAYLSSWVQQSWISDNTDNIGSQIK